MSQTYISSNCLTTGIYQHFGRAYDNPFVASLFVNDDQYVKFCQHFDYYIAQTPKFSLPSEASPWFRQNSGGWYRHEIIHPPYPVMYLDDIEIHWIHEDDEEKLLEKYNRRLKRFQTRNLEPVFLWCSADFLQDHTPEEYTKLISDFISIPTSIYLTRYASDTSLNRSRIVYFEPWADTTDERDGSGLYTFTNINVVSTNFKYILYIVRPVPIKNPLVVVYLIGTPTMWSYTRNYITKLIGSNPNVYVCGFGESIPYTGETVLNTHYSKPHPVEMVGETTEAINQYNLQMCINRCEEERKKLKLAYDYYLYLNVNGLLSTDNTELFPGEKSTYYLHAGASTQSSLTLVSNQHTNLGPVSSLLLEQRKFLFDSIFQGKVADSLDFSTLNLNENSVIFLIPSVIYIAWKNPQRSIFSAQERLNQTLEQIQSIRAQVAEAKIILLEMSEPTLSDLQLLSENADRVCLFTKDEQAQGYAHHHWNKNLGELYVLSYVISKLKLHPVFSHVVKFGGRYKLMSNFQCERITQSKPVFRSIPPNHNCYNQPIIEPVLYSIPKGYLSVYSEALSTIQIRLKTEASDVERMMYAYLPEKIEVDQIGICGYGAVSGVFRII